ncbi:MAG: NUDIX hydrolase [Patescibacteria group bacterium]
METNHQENIGPVLEQFQIEEKEKRRIKRDVVGILICSGDGKFLLGKHHSQLSYGDCFWMIMGGGVEGGESKEEAARREAFEETGVDISQCDLLKIDDTKTGESEKTLSTGERVVCEMRFFDFKVDLSQSSQEIALNPEEREYSEMKWFDTKEISGLVLTPPTRLLFEQLNII